MPVLGLNILGDRGLSESRLVQTARNLNARYHLVMNNPSLAAALVQTGARVIYRHWQNDDNAHRRTDPRERARLLHQLAPPGCLLYLGNEPDRNDLPRLNEWTIVALDECERLGRKGVILNFATGNPEPYDWHALTGCLERAWRGGHILGLHQYFDRTVAVSYPWHIGRERDVYAVSGARTPAIVITELGCAVYYDPYAGYRAALTSDVYGAQLAQAANIYLSQGIYACVFAECQPDDPQWGTFDPTERVLELMAAHNRSAGPPTGEPPVTNPPDTVDKPPNAGQPQTAEVQTGTYIRLRNAPSMRGVEVGQMRQGQRVQWYPQAQRTADGYEWVFLETQQPDGRPLSGWIARVWPTWDEQFKRVPTSGPTPAIPGALLTEARAIQAGVALLEQRATELATEARSLSNRLNQLIAELDKLR